MKKSVGLAILLVLTAAMATLPSQSFAQQRIQQRERAVPPAAVTQARPASEEVLAAPLSLAEISQRFQVNEAAARAHVIEPANVRGINSDLGYDKVRPKLDIPADLGTPPSPHLDVDAFGKALHAKLKNSVAGYVMRLRKNGNTIYTLQWNWARTPSDGGVGWNPSRRMHIASVSKLVTGMAMTKLLNDKGISYDAKIINYLPSYWAKGPNINKITFRHLLTHTSGFSTNSSSSSYSFMKGRVAAGVSGVGSYDYENMNFGLCRILIAIINGNIAKNTNFPLIQDAFWDLVTVSAYQSYVQQKIFTPAGVANGQLDSKPGYALAYKFPVAGGGWNSGNLVSMAGGAAWHLSVDELLNVMGTFRRKGTIMPSGKAQTMLDNGFGVDVVSNTPAGMLYNKNGKWTNNGRTEQSLAYFLPEGMELVVYANSPITASDTFFRTIVSDLYLANLK